MVHVAHDARRACPHRHLQVHATFTVVHRPHYAGDIASVRSPHATGTAHAALQLPDVWRGHAAGAHHAGCSTQFTRVRKCSRRQSVCRRHPRVAGQLAHVRLHAATVTSVC